MQGQTGSLNRPWLIRQTGPISCAIYSYLRLRQYYPQGETKQSDSRLSDKMFETLLLLNIYTKKHQTASPNAQ